MSLNTKLEELKVLGSQKVKDYFLMPSHPMEHGNYLYTYCIERTPAGNQKTLTVSNLDKEPFELPEEIVKSVHEVFGQFSIVLTRTYPMRGYSFQFIQNILEIES